VSMQCKPTKIDDRLLCTVEYQQEAESSLLYSRKSMMDGAGLL
jgi:hypothetical protein